MRPLLEQATAEEKKRWARRARDFQRSAPTAQSAGAGCEIFLHVERTEELRDFFGFQTRRYVTRSTDVDSANGGESHEGVTDGWYLDDNHPAMPKHPPGIGVIFTGKVRPVIHRSGETQYSGMPIQTLTRSHLRNPGRDDSDDGDVRQITEVVSIDECVLDPALFEVPKGFRERSLFPRRLARRWSRYSRLLRSLLHGERPLVSLHLQPSRPWWNAIPFESRRRSDSCFRFPTGALRILRGDTDILNLCRPYPSGTAYREGALRRRCSVFLAVAILPFAVGCSPGDVDLAAAPHLTRYSWGTEFRSTNPEVSFPLPKGWKLVDAKAPGGRPNAVRLQSESGACQLILSRAPAGESPSDALDALREALVKDGRLVDAKGAQQVGNLHAQRMDVSFGKGLTEQIYTMQTGAWLLTLITVHSQRCGTEFDDTLRGFRA